GAIDVTASGGTAPYTYSWTGPNGYTSTTEDPTGLLAGVYNVTVIDANGNAGTCQALQAVTITEPAAALSVALTSQTNILCYGNATGAIDVTASGGTAPYTYSWTGPNGYTSTTEDPTGLLAGVYNVTVIDANGNAGTCQALQAVTLTEPTALLSIVVDNQTNISCNGGSDGIISISVSGGTAPYTYSWSGPNGYSSALEDLTGLSFGTYSVSVIDANGNAGSCFTTATITLSEPQPLQVTINGDAIACYGNADGNVTGTITGGTPPYIVTLVETGANQVVATDGGVYDFSGLSGLASGGFATYSVTVSDANGTSGGCGSLMGPVTMTEPEQLLVTINGDAILCYGNADGNVTGTITGGTAPYSVTLVETGTTQVVASDGGTYDFSGLSGLASGGFATYSVTVSDANGTSGGCGSLMGPVTMTEPDQLVVTINGDAILCYGNADGNVTGTVTGGTAPYTVTLVETGTTQVVATDGGAYDFSGLSGLASGGFATYSVTVSDANGSLGGCGSLMGPVTMSEPNLLDLSASLTTNYNGYGVSCYQLADGAITATVTGGTEIPAGGYIYNWTTDPATSTASIPAGQSTVVSPTGLTAGNYLVTVTDQNGCTISGQVSVNEPAQLIVTSLVPSVYASGYNITGCFPDGYAEVTVSGGVPGYTYDWNNDGTGDYNDANPVINIAEGWLVITTQDLNGCVISDSVFMDAPDVITIVGLSSFTYPSGDNISCFGLNDGSIDLTITGGTGPYNYNWTSDPATPSATIPSGQGAVEDPQGLTAGTYLITITDVDGCSQDSLINLTEPSELVQNGSSFVYPSGDNIQCHGDANGSMMNYTVSGGSPAYSYSWTANPSSATAIVPAGQGDQVNPTGLTAGTYNVIVTDINGCSIDTSITLIEPAVLSQTGSAFTFASSDNIQCNGDANGSIVNYTVTGGSPAYSYSWTADPLSSTAIVPAGQGNQVNPTGLTAGTYNVIVTDINGCSIDTSITLIEPAVLSQTGSAFTFASSDNIQCNGDANGSIVNYTVTGGSPAYSYSWTADPLSLTANVPLGQGNQVNPTGLSAGTYNVTVTDLNGCTIDTSITLVEPSPLGQTAVAFTYTSGTNISCYNLNDGSIDLTVNGGSPAPGYSYNWAVVTPGSLPAGQNSVEDPSGLTDGVYQVTITDINGCTIDTTITLVEPSVLNATAVLSVYSGGYNLSGCQSDGWIDLSVSGGNPGYAISWNNGLESEDLASLSAGIYTVTITDVNGCQFILDTTLTQPQSISSQTQVTSDYNGEDISCIGAS
ncbi:MAG: beta strand repeat-containing protein, partial [Flavobacteriia bacterium]